MHKFPKERLHIIKLVEIDELIKILDILEKIKIGITQFLLLLLLGGGGEEHDV